MNKAARQRGLSGGFGGQVSLELLSLAALFVLRLLVFPVLTILVLLIFRVLLLVLAVFLIVTHLRSRSL